MKDDQLDLLSSKELHDRAMKVATKRADLAFFWSLVEAVPAARAASGHLDAAETDVVSLSSLISDVMHSGEGDTAEALRPFYLEYLKEHQG